MRDADRKIHKGIQSLKRTKKHYAVDQLFAESYRLRDSRLTCRRSCDLIRRVSPKLARNLRAASLTY